MGEMGKLNLLCSGPKLWQKEYQLGENISWQKLRSFRASNAEWNKMGQNNLARGQSLPVVKLRFRLVAADRGI